MGQRVEVTVFAACAVLMIGVIAYQMSADANALPGSQPAYARTMSPLGAMPAAHGLATQTTADPI